MNSDHGTSGGIKLTNDLIEQLAKEAEDGYAPAQLGRRLRRGRPPLGEEAASVFQVRLDPRLRRALEQRADAEETSSSDIARRALEAFLFSNPIRTHSG